LSREKPGHRTKGVCNKKGDSKNITIASNVKNYQFILFLRIRRRGDLGEKKKEPSGRKKIRQNQTQDLKKTRENKKESRY